MSRKGLRGNEPGSLRKYAERLFVCTEERSEFVAAVAAGRSKFPCVISFSEHVSNPGSPNFQPSWAVTREDGEPGYPLDLSSIFSGSIVRDLDPIRVLDLCASPGGKSLQLARYFPNATLYSNEIVPKRAATLLHTLDKFLGSNYFVSNLSPSVLAAKAEDCFDLVFVDAPCSGQSLLARGKDAFGCFLPDSIRGCAKRQRQIVADAIKMVRPGGYLAYSTCTYSIEENEEILDGIDGVEGVELEFLAEFRSQFGTKPSYRLYPHLGLGAGGFVGMLQRTGQSTSHDPDLTWLQEHAVEFADQVREHQKKSAKNT